MSSWTVVHTSTSRYTPRVVTWAAPSGVWPGAGRQTTAWRSANRALQYLQAVPRHLTGLGLESARPESWQDRRTCGARPPQNDGSQEHSKHPHCSVVWSRKQTEWCARRLPERKRLMCCRQNSMQINTARSALDPPPVATYDGVDFLFLAQMSGHACASHGCAASVNCSLPAAPVKTSPSASRRVAVANAVPRASILSSGLWPCSLVTMPGKMLAFDKLLPSTEKVRYPAEAHGRPGSASSLSQLSCVRLGLCVSESHLTGRHASRAASLLGMYVQSGACSCCSCRRGGGLGT